MGRGRFRHQPDCDCDYFPGGCRVRKILQSISYKRRRKKLTCLGKSPKLVTPLHFKVPKEGVLGQYFMALTPLPSKTNFFYLFPYGKTDHASLERMNSCPFVQIVAPVKMANRACRCQYSFLWTCTGLSVPCRNSNSNFCKTPGTSLAHCRQGGGDCGGY